jgi:hypothetical protein
MPKVLTLFVRCLLAWSMLVLGPLVWLNYNGWNLKLIIHPADMAVDQSLAVDAPLPVSSFFADGSDGIANPAFSNLRLFEDGQELGPPHSSHATIRAIGRGAYSHWTHKLWFSSSDGTSPMTNGRSYRAELIVYPRLRGELFSVAIPVAAFAVILAFCQLMTTRKKPQGDSLARRLKLVSQIRPTAREWMELGGLTLVYGAALFLITTSLAVQQNNAGVSKINFEYRVF